MFKHLAKLFRRDSDAETIRPSSVTPAPSSGPDTGMNEMASGTTEALKRFMYLVTAHLGHIESQRLTDAVLASFEMDGDPSEAFQESFHGDEGQKRGQWFVIQCDWKAFEEVEWQIAEVASSFCISERWTWDASEAATRTVPAGLCDAARWAAPLGFELLHLDLGGDAYYAIMVKRSEAEEACRTADAAGLIVLRTPEFEKFNA
jgi:hypothetical protein